MDSLAKTGTGYFFVHSSASAADAFKTLQQGDQVEFEIVHREKRPQAANVITLPANGIKCHKVTVGNVI